MSTVLFCIAVAQWNVNVYCNYAIECELHQLNLVQYYFVCYPVVSCIIVPTHQLINSHSAF